MRFLTIITCCGLFLSACDSDQVSKRLTVPKLVEAYQVEMKPLALEQTVSSLLKANSEITISNQEQGQLVSLPYREGDLVEKDSELGKIDDRLLQKELDKALAAEKLAQLDAKRVSRLYKRKLTSEDELARAESALAQAKAETALLNTRVKQTSLIAPFSGVISQRLQDHGDILPLYEPVLTLMDISSLKAQVQVSETLINTLRTDMTVKVRIDALGATYFDAAIVRIFPTVDPDTHQGTFEFKLQPVPDGARPGQLCRLKLQHQTSPRLVIPLRAIQRDTEGEFVFIINKDNKAIKQPIETGLQDNNNVEILSGINHKQLVITRGFIDLRDNQLVKVITPDKNTIN